MGLVMAYLQKVEQKDGRRIMADRRSYHGNGAPRAVSTWEEAHAVFLEIENDKVMSEGQKCCGVRDAEGGDPAGEREEGAGFE